MAEPTQALDRGSVLLLFPAAFLVVLVLGAIAIDSGAAFLAQRELAAAADSAANDAVTLAVEASLARGSEPTIDAGRAEDAVRRSLERRGVIHELSAPPRVRVIAPDRLEVHLEARAPRVIAPALPGSDDEIVVQATVVARLVVDDG